MLGAQGLSFGDTWPEVREKQERDHKLLLIRETTELKQINQLISDSHQI